MALEGHCQGKTLIFGGRHIRGARRVVNMSVALEQSWLLTSSLRGAKTTSRELFLVIFFVEAQSMKNFILMLWLFLRFCWCGAGDSRSEHQDCRLESERDPRRGGNVVIPIAEIRKGDGLQAGGGDRHGERPEHSG